MESATSRPSVVVTRHDAVLHVRIDRPEVRNAIDQAVAAGVAEAVDELERDAGLRVMVIDGARETFSSGMDLKAFLAGERPVVDERGLLGFARKLPAKPIVAAVEGYALGAGFEAVLSCDVVVAAESAVFGLPETQRGLLAGGGGLIHLSQRVPRAVASDLVLTGRRISADEAHRLGLVSRVVARGDALTAALQVADEIAAAPAVAVEAARAVLHATRSVTVDEAYALQDPWFRHVFDSAESRQGAAAFLDRARPPEEHP